MDVEIVDAIGGPEKTALVVWDVQKALVDRIFNREEFLGNLGRRRRVEWAYYRRRQDSGR